MIKGTVKFFNGAKGFGFITPDDGTKEVFVPTATVTSSGAGPLTAGQRVSFEAELESRGPKAVKLKLLDEPPREPVREAPREQMREAPRASLTLYHETDCEDAADVMAALSEAGHSVRQVDYIATPPPREDLKRLSLMLREANQSLARRYEPLFMELQLDDRFISENEFLTAIFEHPSLINGPILVSPGKARICRTAEDVLAFLGNGAMEERRPKGISPRMAAMMLGKAVPPAPANEEEVEEAVIPARAPAKIVVSEKPAKVAVSEKPVKAAASETLELEPEFKLEFQAVPAPKARAAGEPRKAVAAAPVKKPAAKAPVKKPAAPVPVKKAAVKVVKAKAVKAKAPAKPVKKAKK